MLWTAFLTWPLMGAVQMMCARIGMVTGEGLAAALQARFPRWLVGAVVIALLIVNTVTVAADLSGMADAAEMLTHINSHICVILFGVGISLATIFFRYHQIATILKWLALVLFQRRRWAANVVVIVAVSLFAATYVALIVWRWPGNSGGFSSLAGVAALFSDQWLMVAGWLHYLAFDLLVGRWEAQDAESRGLEIVFAENGREGIEAVSARSFRIS